MPLLSRKCFILTVLLVCGLLLPTSVFAQRSSSELTGGGRDPAAAAEPLGMIFSVDLDVYLRGPDRTLVDVIAVVTLTKIPKQFYRQGTTKAGHVRFDNVDTSEYSIQVVAPGYERAVKEFDAHGTSAMMVTIELRPSSDREDAAFAVGHGVLTPKAQKELGKALEALHANKPTEARSHLDAARRLAPNHPEVNYLYGVYSSQLSDWVQAKSYWIKTLDLYPQHLHALLSLSEALLRENKPGEALPYLNRAVEAEPSAWRAHSILADAYLHLNLPNEAIQHAERALELGHGHAAAVQRLLARGLAGRGEKERAAGVLQTYLQDHTADVEAQKQLESLQTPPMVIGPGDTMAGTTEVTASAATTAAAPLPLPSSWLPPDVDEKVPPVEPGAVCPLDEVVQKAGNRIQELVRNVDRFTATESLVHESINKWGMASSPEKRKFDYVVSIEETRPGLLNVEEYRRGGPSVAEFPESVATNGLPALVLVFHPADAGNFEMKCEGLARWNGGLAWQIHFRQRNDRPNTMRAYRLGTDGPSYAVALKGRAWIEADSYQIVRLETDLIAPLPQIRLAADHTAIEYGPVEFRERKVNMWLPKSAEVYFDWRGKRIHRRHSFSNYLLFSIDEKQRISDPKSEE